MRSFHLIARGAVFVLTAVILGSGCSFSKKDAAGASPVTGSVSGTSTDQESGEVLPAASPTPSSLPIPAVPMDGWVTELDTNHDLADLTTTRMTSVERERVRNEVTRNNVTWVNSRTGYSLYKINGSERFSKSAFIMPKILVIGSVDGGRASLRELPNGRVALTIPVALIDGSQKELSYSTTRIKVPDNLYLDDSKREIIKKDLVEAFGYAHEIASLGSCPKTIMIKIAGVDHDVTPRVFGGPTGPTGCQPNQPFTVTLEGNKKYIERFLSDDVFNGSAEIAAMYEVAGSYTDEIRLYQIKTAPFYAGLKALLVKQTDKGSEKKEITQEESDKTLEPFVREALSKWSTKERFWEQVKTNAIIQLRLIYFSEKTTDKGSLFILKDEAEFKPHDVPVRIVNESLGRQGEQFYSSSIIKPILNSTNIAVRGEERKDLWFPPRNGVVQDVFTVHEGDRYELQLTSLVIHEYEFADELTQPKIQDNGLVCLDKPGEALPACRKYKNECIERKNFCKKPKAGCTKYGTKTECNTTLKLSITGCLTLGIFGDCGIRRECQQVPDTGTCVEYGEIGCEEWSDYCSQTRQICEPGSDEPLCRNQISDLRITKYYTAPAPVNNHLVNAPFGSTDQDIIGGLYMRFRWPDGKTIDCVIGGLITDVIGQSIRIRVKNSDSCQPFPEGYKGTPVMAVLNKISTQRRDIPCGIMNSSTVEGVKYYGCNNNDTQTPTPDQYKPGEGLKSGVFSSTPLHITYYPVVDLNGILISRSNAFTSGDTTTEGEWEE